MFSFEKRRQNGEGNRYFLSHLECTVYPTPTLDDFNMEPKIRKELCLG